MKTARSSILVAISIFSVACTQSRPLPSIAKSPSIIKEEEKRGRVFQTGKASWYGGRFHGGPTASGERYNQNSMTAAHKKLPMGTRVRVTNLANGKSCIVRINNRGPYIRGRIIDLSRAAFQKISSLNSGVIHVRIELL
jgi:rare lipoprotein A